LLFIFPVYAATVRSAKVYTCVTVVSVPVAAAALPVELADADDDGVTQTPDTTF